LQHFADGLYACEYIAGFRCLQIRVIDTADTKTALGDIVAGVLAQDDDTPPQLCL